MNAMPTHITTLSLLPTPPETTMHALNTAPTHAPSDFIPTGCGFDPERNRILGL
jgi:hypothetical protein